MNNELHGNQYSYQTTKFLGTLQRCMNPDDYQRLLTAYEKPQDEIADLLDGALFNYLDFSNRHLLNAAEKSLIKLGESIENKSRKCPEKFSEFEFWGKEPRLPSAEAYALLDTARMDWALPAVTPRQLQLDRESNWNYFLGACCVLINETEILSLLWLERWRCRVIRQIKHGSS